MIPLRYIVVIAIYFLIGAIVTWFVNRRELNRMDVRYEVGKEKCKQRWVKFTWYFLIVVPVLFILNEPRLNYGFWLLLLSSGLFELLRLVFRTKSGRPIQAILEVAVYILLASIILIGAPLIEPAQQAKLYLLILVFDGFSQLSGQLFGRHKLSPNVSPNKTWEGFAGGLVMTLLTWYLIEWAAISFSKLLFAGVVISITALIGDLLASSVKRSHGVKDYSSLIPGHGGLLDRFDSFIMAMAVVVIFYQLNIQFLWIS